jgi:hypothetical protein
LETAAEIVVHRRISDGVTNVGEVLHLRVNQSGGRMAVEHVCSLEDVYGVLTL